MNKSKYYQENKERLKSESNLYYHTNIDRVKAQRKIYREKNRDQIKLAKKLDYEKTKERRNPHRKEYREKNRNEFILTYKKDKSCAFCGYKEYPEILHFHHKDMKDKSFDISVIRRNKSLLLKSEIDKCILLCPNCHSWLHFKENQDLKFKLISKKIAGKSGLSERVPQTKFLNHA
ncbi:MAG: HNH endonuclease signature motif containing protein [Nanoarchaeota archaeon]